MVADRARDADAAWRRQPLQPHRDIDAVAINVAAVDDQVTEIDADAKSQAAFLGKIQIAVDHRALDFAGAAHRVDHAGEFRQHAVAGGLDDPTWCSRIFGSTSSCRCALKRSWVPSSSAPIKRE